MEHLLLKAATTVATDQGQFEAVISTATIDREKDIVDPAGFVRALHKWVPLGKKIPLAWNHSAKAEDQIGYIDPASARVQGSEVVVKGQIDLSSQVGQNVWRMVKMGTLGFSFGYLVPPGGSTPRKGGGRHIRETDVYEVTATHAPMNGDTRVLGYKAVVTPDGTVLSDQADADVADTPLQAIADAIEELQEFIDAENGEGDKTDAVQAERLITNLQALYRTEQGQDDTGKALRVPDGAEWLFPEAELAAARAGELKAVWTTAYVNDLPDSAFLYVEPGGDKDSEGKTTPRSLRHFPVRDASGAVDQAHVRNALARIPQSDLPQTVKDSATAKAQRILDAQKSVDATGKETKASRSVDPLRAKADALVLEFVSDGESQRKPPQQKAAPKAEPEYTPERLRELTREYTLIALTGDTENESP